jgi:hypothetical protein
VAFNLVAIYKPGPFECWWLLDYFLTALVIEWIAGILMAIMCFLMKIIGK